MGIPVLVISGSLGTGKTLVLGEASDILAENGVPHAAFDLDSAFAWPDPQDSSGDPPLHVKNLASVWANFVDAGASRFLIAGAVESRDERDHYQASVPGGEFVVCRLLASADTRRRRLREREPGARILATLLRRSDEVDAKMEREHLEDFAVSNDGRAVADVAVEVLSLAGWLPARR